MEKNILQPDLIFNYVKVWEAHLAAASLECTDCQTVGSCSLFTQENGERRGTDQYNRGQTPHARADATDKPEEAPAAAVPGEERALDAVQPTNQVMIICMSTLYQYKTPTLQSPNKPRLFCFSVRLTQQKFPAGETPFWRLIEGRRRRA